jgi:hypothetical protein
MAASYSQLASPPNLMSLYLQLQQRQQASDQINRGFALIAANHSAPGMREAIMNSVGGGPNAGQQVGDLMQLYSAQQQMAGQQQMLGQADDIDKRLNLPPGTARSMILQGRGSELISKLEPTDEQRNIQAKHDMFIKGGGSEDDWQRNYLPMIISGGVGGDAATRSWQQERIIWNRDNPGQPPPWGTDTPENFALYKQDQKKRQDNVDTAAGNFGQYDSGLSDVRGKITAIQSNPELKNVLQNPALVAAVKAGREQGSDPTVWNSISAAAKDAFAKATPEQKQLASDILDLSDPAYVKDLQGKSSTVTQGDILPITSALTSLGRFNTPLKQYNTLLGGALDAVDKARANNYGASGQLNIIPDGDEGDALRKRVNNAYLPGGGSFVGQGKPMPPDELAAAKKAIADDPAQKATVVDLYRRHGYNTKPIE